MKDWIKCHWTKCHFKSLSQFFLDNHIYFKHTRILQNNIGKVTHSQNYSMVIQTLELNENIKAIQNDQKLTELVQM